MAPEPGLQAGKRLRIEPGAIGFGELPHEGKDRGVAQAPLVPAEICLHGEPPVERGEQFQARRAMLRRIGGMAIGILVAIEEVLERTIDGLEQVAVLPA